MAQIEMDVKAKIRSYMENNFMVVGNESIADSDSFMEKGIIDSTGILEVVGYIQSEFEITVADEEMLPDNLDSIAKIAAYIVRKSAS